MIDLKYIEVVQVLDWDESPMHEQISSEMFGVSDIESVDYTENGGFLVRMRGLNGVLQSRLFTKRARQKIIRCDKILKSPLWRAIND